MLNLSKWSMLICATTIAVIAPCAAIFASTGTTDAEPIETGMQVREYAPTFSYPVVPIKQEPKVVTPPAPEPTPTPEPQEEPEPKEQAKPERRSETYTATAYTIGKGQVPNLKGITATGTKVQKGRTIAVDPDVIPLGSLVYIESDFPGVTGEYVAEDTGSAINGRKIDLFLGWGGKGTAAYREAMEFGRRTLEITILRKGPKHKDAI